MMNLWKIRNIANMIFITALVFTFIIIITIPEPSSNLGKILLYAHIKGYFITGRANVISCAVGLRLIPI